MRRTLALVGLLALLAATGGWSGCLSSGGQAAAPPRLEPRPPRPAQSEESFANPLVHRRFGFRLVWEAEIPLAHISRWWLEPLSLYAITGAGPHRRPRLYAVDRATGVVKWQAVLPEPISDQPLESVSVTKQGANERIAGFWLVYNVQERLYGLDITTNSRTGQELGELRWSMSLDTVAGAPQHDPTAPQDMHSRRYNSPRLLPHWRYGVRGEPEARYGDAPLAQDDHLGTHVRRSAMVLSSPLAMQHREPTRLFVGSYDGFFYAVDINTLDRAWKFRTHEAVTDQPLALDDFVFITTEAGEVHALNAKNGAAVWNTPFRRQPGAACHLGASQEYLFVACEDYNLYAINRLGGNLEATYRAGIPLREAPQGLHDRAYFRDTEGMFWCLKVASQVSDGALLLGSDGPGRERLDKRFWWPQPSVAEGRPWVWRLRGGQRIIAVGQEKLLARPPRPRTIYLLKDGNVLAAVNDDTGEVYWEYPLQDFSHPLGTVFPGEELPGPYLFLADAERGKAWCFVEDDYYQSQEWQQVQQVAAQPVNEEVRLQEAIRDLGEREVLTGERERERVLYDDFLDRLRRLKLLPRVRERPPPPGVSPQPVAPPPPAGEGG